MNGWGHRGGQQGPTQNGQQPRYDAQGAVILDAVDASAAASVETAAANGQVASPQPTASQLPAATPGVPLWEWLGVGVVGVGLGLTARTFGARGVMVAAGLYALGYWVRGRRPSAGWQAGYLPSPLFAMLPQQKG